MAQSGSNPRVLMVASPGGHLSQMKLLTPCFADFERRWVTLDHESVDVDGDELVFGYGPTTRNAVNLLRNLRLAWRELRTSRPDMIVSTGAAIAVPFFVLGRLLGIRTVFLEVYDRVDSRTLTARLVKPFTDAFLLQWESQRDLYGSGSVVGPVY